MFLFMDTSTNIFQDLPVQDRAAVSMMDIDFNLDDSDVAAVSHIPPPGEEGFDFSHEGREFEAIDDLANDMAKITGLYVCFSIPFTQPLIDC